MGQQTLRNDDRSIKSLNGGPTKGSSLVSSGIAGITWIPAAGDAVIGAEEGQIA